MTEVRRSIRQFRRWLASATGNLYAWPIWSSISGTFRAAIGKSNATE